VVKAKLHRIKGFEVLVAVLPVIAAAIFLLAPTTADAEPRIESFEASTSTAQAGGHPDLHFKFWWSTRLSEPPPPGTCNCQDAEFIVLHLPTGVIGNPHAVPTCSAADFALDTCPPEAQVGALNTIYWSPVYNLVPHPGQAGLTGAHVPAIEIAVYTEFRPRTDSDYGLDAVTSGIFHLLPLPRIDVTYWGVPAASSHDAGRYPRARDGGCGYSSADETCYPPIPSNVPPVPFLSNPTTCGESLSTNLEIGYYDGTITHADAAWPATTGCDQLGFDPSLTAKPTTSMADTASGLDVAVTVPQPLSPSVPSPSELRNLTVTLPEGFSLIPNGSDGKSYCSTAQAAFGTRGEAHCPEFSKIGTSTLESSALPGPIHGGIYIGEPLSGQMFRYFITADGFATHVKLEGKVFLDPETGQIVNTFVDQPQSPFQELDLHFFGSERGLYGTPTHCGTYEVKTVFEPWDAALANQTSTSFFAIDSGPNGAPCPGARLFAPKLKAGMADNTAGAHSPFTLKLSRDDGEQNMTSLVVAAPPGFAATLKGIPYCPPAALAQLADPIRSGLVELATPACPAASQIGTLTAGSGAGTHPIYNDGRVYLAGPYKGAPLSLVASVPALGGPYDIGTVAVRTAIQVDPATTQVTTVSDPLPQILSGVPLRTRTVQVNLDRPDFTLNPTNCAPGSVSASLVGDEGGTAIPDAHYQVANCASLAYSPKLSLTLSGGVRRRGHPAIHAVLKTSRGEANSRSVSVTLPKGELLDNSHISTVCTRVAFADRACPSGSMIGQATAVTPLLGQPLTGSVYLRASSHTLPDMVVDLHGQLNLELVGRIDAVGGRLRTTFAHLPDAAVDTFTLDLLGGANGLLVNSESLCGVRKSAVVRMVGQNGAELKSRSGLHAQCGAHSARYKRHVMRLHRSAAVR
jgi:hypothetical protein